MVFQKSRVRIGIIVIALLIIGGGSWYLLQNRINNGEGVSCVNGYKKYTKENFGFFEEALVNFEFEYPCEWIVTNFPDTNHIVISSPGNSASFAWPIVNADMADFTTDGGTFMTMVNGVEYMGHRYSGPTKTIDFIYLPVTDGTILNGIYVTYTDDMSKEKVEKIISSISF